MTKCIKLIRDLFEYAQYKFTLYLLTYAAARYTWKSRLAVVDFD